MSFRSLSKPLFRTYGPAIMLLTFLFFFFSPRLFRFALFPTCSDLRFCFGTRIGPRRVLPRPFFFLTRSRFSRPYLPEFPPREASSPAHQTQPVAPRLMRPSISRPRGVKHSGSPPVEPFCFFDSRMELHLVPRRSFQFSDAL